MKRSAPIPVATIETLSAPSAMVLVRGVETHSPLHTAAVSKATKLLRHHRRIIRVRIDFEQERASHCAKPAIASGRIEISGPDIVARVASTSLSQSLDLLIEKLDRMLRERTKHRVNRRNDRPPGAEFRDFLAVPGNAAGRLRATPTKRPSAGNPSI